MSQKVKPQQQRKFLGKTENFTNKEEKRFYQKMLKAYLKGYERFRHGFETIKVPSGLKYRELRQPKWFTVQQQHL